MELTEDKIIPKYGKICGHCNRNTSLRTQYQVKNETQIKKNQKVIKNDNDELVVKNYPKSKQPIIQQRKGNLPSCPSCKRNNWLEFDKSYNCKNCEYLINRNIR